MVLYTVTEFKKQASYDEYSSFILGADVGGTNTNIAIAGVKQKIPELLFSLNFKSNGLSDASFPFIQTLRYAKQQFNITVTTGCVGAAGVVSNNHQRATLTNLSWNIDCEFIREKTGMESLFVINDFQIIGYGLTTLNQRNTDDMILLTGSNLESKKKEPKIIIGAGTGLGKCFLIYNKHKNTYLPFPSEGGHADLPLYTSAEFELVQYIQQKHNQHNPVTYEQVVSGPGLMNIYEFLSTKETDKRDDEPNIETPDDISLYRKKSNLCNKTCEMFLTFYARCIKNYILDTMALGGAYIAGGIAMNDTELFQSSTFFNAVANAFQRNDLLHPVPLYVITNPHVSLKGACLAAITNNIA